MIKHWSKNVFCFILFFTLVGCSNEGTENSMEEGSVVEYEQGNASVDEDNEGESNEEQYPAPIEISIKL